MEIYKLDHSVVRTNWQPSSEPPVTDGEYLVVTEVNGMLRMKTARYCDCMEDLGWMWTSVKPVWYHTDENLFYHQDNVLFWAPMPEWPKELESDIQNGRSAAHYPVS